MKKFTLLIVLSFGIFFSENIFADCNAPSNVTVTPNIERPSGSGIYGIQIGWMANGAGQSFDVLVLRENGFRDTINVTGANNCFIPYTELYNAVYSFSVRKHCTDTTESVWTTPVKRLVESELAMFDRLTACPGVHLNATGYIDGFMKEIEIDCENFTGTISPQIYVTGGTISGYTVESIPYAPPFSFADGNNIFYNGPSGQWDDDVFGDIVNLPFPFCFYDGTYNQCVVGANGLVSFKSSQAGQQSGFSLQDLSNIPNTNMDNRWLNAIYGVMEDIDPRFITEENSGGHIKLGLLGEYPCRVLKVSWYNIPVFNHHNLWNSYMIILYEGSNVIDVYVRKRYTYAWNGGRGVIGVQNHDGLRATAAPGRNLADIWTVGVTAGSMPEAWRFNPISTPTYTMTWYSGRGTNGPVLGVGRELPINFGELQNDTITVSLQSSSCNGTYFDVQDTAVIRWNVPTANISDSVCMNTRYTRHGFNIDPQTVSDTIINFHRVPETGGRCDSIYNLKLKIMPEKAFEFDKNICNGESFEFDGQRLTTAGRYSKTIPSLQGCDSVVYCNLNVSPALKLTVAEIPDEICADDPTFKIPFSLQEGNTTGFNVAFSQKAANAGFVSRQYNRETNEEITIDIPPDVKPDYYSMKVVFEDTVFRCGDVEDSIFFKVYYKNAIIEQNWNDVIALLNKTYNGNYEFNRYQWYKNSLPIIEGQQKIEEQTSSYLYLPEGLDLNAYYRLEITRIDDNVTLFTCPIMPVQFVAESDAPVVSQQQGIVRISTAAGGYVNVWNIYGQMLYKKNLSNETELNLPIAGVYILEIMLDNGIRTVEKVVIK